MKEIYSALVEITDRGVTFPLSREIEVHKPIEKNVKKWLKKNKHAMDLSNKFEFKITKTYFVGYSTCQIMKKRMSQEEIRHLINRWKKLKPSKIRDMAIKIWSKGLNQKKDE